MAELAPGDDVGKASWGVGLHGFEGSPLSLEGDDLRSCHLWPGIQPQDGSAGPAIDHVCAPANASPNSTQGKVSHAGAKPILLLQLCLCELMRCHIRTEAWALDAHRPDVILLCQAPHNQVQVRKEGALQLGLHPMHTISNTPQYVGLLLEPPPERLQHHIDGPLPHLGGDL
jgi:hypothetical protein